ncbi:MAG: low molecular weight protein-tyrosine-phosphatase, partial [Flavobacteriaceae bacterium]
TGGWHSGETPDKRSVKVGQKYGVDISPQRARQFSKQDFEAFDIIYVMDAVNYQDVLGLTPDKEAEDKIRLIMNELPGFENTAVPDPYWGTVEDFEQVYRLLDKVCSKIAEKLLNQGV